ncbi:hypothetical protein AOQ84DRAFT_413009 [Glonium stellatum]|uniref:Uncharacterized protein n=1 Tax=Glonium stellatum TaxID=574774 RepID=A0A8E2EVN1_9PEZI|nr:hypothetical protein AOQ84DRAFT_413009 [Glonium stellatum]
MATSDFQAAGIDSENTTNIHKKLKPLELDREAISGAPHNGITTSPLIVETDAKAALDICQHLAQSPVRRDIEGALVNAPRKKTFTPLSTVEADAKPPPSAIERKVETLNNVLPCYLAALGTHPPSLIIETKLQQLLDALFQYLAQSLSQNTPSSPPIIETKAGATLVHTAVFGPCALGAFTEFIQNLGNAPSSPSTTETKAETTSLASAPNKQAERSQGSLRVNIPSPHMTRGQALFQRPMLSPDTFMLVSPGGMGVTPVGQQFDTSAIKRYFTSLQQFDFSPVEGYPTSPQQFDSSAAEGYPILLQQFDSSPVEGYPTSPQQFDSSAAEGYPTSLQQFDSSTVSEHLAPYRYGSGNTKTCGNNKDCLYAKTLTRAATYFIRACEMTRKEATLSGPSPAKLVRIAEERILDYVQSLVYLSEDWKWELHDDEKGDEKMPEVVVNGVIEGIYDLEMDITRPRLFVGQSKIHEGRVGYRVVEVESAWEACRRALTDAWSEERISTKFVIAVAWNSPGKPTNKELYSMCRDVDGILIYV